MRWPRRTSTSCTSRKSVSCVPRGIVASASVRSRKKNAGMWPSLPANRRERRERLVERGEDRDWPLSMVAQMLEIQTPSLRRWKRRCEHMPEEPVKRGRPEVIPPEARWKLRDQYLSKYGQWGPSVLRAWAIREGIGKWSADTISRVIADLKPKQEPRAKPRKYEIAAPMAVWSEDGTKFKDRGRKKELIVLQDECARYKTNWKLADGPANALDVCEYLREAFEAHGAPLVLKHDGGAIFHEDDVRELLDKYNVVDLTSPSYYPQYNGKKERSMRDIKGFVHALYKHEAGGGLAGRIEMAMHDLNIDRPRPVLGGRTAREVFEQDRIRLPEHRRFKMEVRTRQLELEAEAESRREKADARRRAVIEVLSRYGLLKWRGDVSTNFRTQTGTT